MLLFFFIQNSLKPVLAAFSTTVSFLLDMRIYFTVHINMKASKFSKAGKILPVLHIFKKLLSLTTWLMKLFNLI